MVVRGKEAMAMDCNSALYNKSLIKKNPLNNYLLVIYIVEEKNDQR